MERLKTSSKGISLIKKFEGCRLKAYKCPSGIWSIGYGHTKGVKPGDIITQEQAEEFLFDDLAIYENAVMKYNDIYGFNQNQFDALVSFTYNCGTGNLKNLTQNGKRTINQISAKLLLYNKSGGVILKGLQLRRAEEKALFDTHIKSYKTDYYPKYTGDSLKIDEVFSAIGATIDYDNIQDKPYLKRKPIATANGIAKYTGTAAQNNKLIKLAKDGKLVTV